MSRLSELIAELCPDGVEYKQLQDVVSLQRGVRVVKKDLTIQGLYPVYQNSLVPLGYHSKSNCSAGTTFIICAGAAGGVGYSNVDFWAADDCFYLEHSDSFDEKFAFYALQSNQHKLDANVRRASIPRLPRWVLDELLIPVPPIEIQREIVRILDSFQELDDALTAEIEAREKQLATMCDRFVCNEAFEQKTLGEVCQLRKGRGLQKKDFSDSGIGCIHYGQIYTRFGLDTKETLTYVPEDKANGFTWVEPNDIVVAITSENVEDVCKSVVWTGKERIVTGAHAVVLHPKINSLYLAYCLQSHDFDRQKIMIVDGVKVIEMKIERLSLVKLRVPSRLIQDEIVDKLESVRGLINEMKCERDVRRKQFAYYRDKLLDLPEKVTTNG